MGGTMSVRRILGRPEFRSSREKVCYGVGSFVVSGLLIIPATYMGLAIGQWVTWALAVSLTSLFAWFSWQRWGRERFPMPPPGEPQSAE